MAGQAEFLEMIQELERIAKTNSDHLSMEEIRQYFSDMNLADEQFDYICRYLESKNIMISDRVERKAEVAEDAAVETKEDPQDDDITRLYIEEAAARTALSESETLALLERLEDGDGEAISELIERNLSLAIEVAGTFKNQGMLYSDLIQEANVGLMLAVSELASGDVIPVSKEALETYLKKAMRIHLTKELSMYNTSTRSAMKMADQINDMNLKTMQFAKENGREAKPDELAKIMGITEEEVRDLMKVSLDAVSVMDSGDVGDFDQLSALAEGQNEEELELEFEEE